MEFDDSVPNPAVVNAAIMETLDNQLREGDPPETRATYDRLLSKGIEREEVRRLIGCVIAAEIFNIMKYKQPFNEVRFAARLNALPDMLWMDE